jgi:hypothetical protein
MKLAYYTSLCPKYKVKEKFSLCSINYAVCHEDVLGEWTHRAPPFLTSALDGNEWITSSPGRFTFREKYPGTQ